jgi:hypothetical protein
MEPKFRPIPITILDFLGSLLPGFVWFVLFITTRALFPGGEMASTQPGPYTPLWGWRSLVELSRTGDSLVDKSGTGDWLAAFAIVVASLIIGFALKAVAMPWAGWLSKPLFFLSRETKGRSAPKFPFETIFESKLIEKVGALVERRTGIKQSMLPKDQPFSSAKRFLRLVAPELWEESERMVAEVRMIGALYLAALYCTVIQGLLAVRAVLATSLSSATPNALWALASVIVAGLLGHAFNKRRYSEVAYTYLNALLADRKLRVR